jgi:16S rRNA G966 N2-methylase RsmD
MNNRITWQFIENHRDDDVQHLALKGCLQTEIDFQFALQQIAGRQKIKNKLPLLYAQSKICYPGSLALEQCSSQETAHYKAKLVRGDLLFDLTAGFGIDAMAFACRIQQVVAVERQTDLCTILQHNAALLHLNNIKVVNADATSFLSSCESADTIYLDPARRNAQGKKVADLMLCDPNILNIKYLLLKKCRKRVILKLSPMLDLKATWRQLPAVSEIHIVAVRNECKEILFIIDNDKITDTQNNNPKIIAIDLAASQEMPFCYRWQEEISTPLQLGNGVAAYLYEPHAALMKAGAYKLLAMRYGLEMLHPHTHLYTSHSLIANFPGHCYQVKSVLPFHKNNLKNLHKTVPCANVAVRNFPLSAEALKKRFRIRDGGTTFLFGVTLHGEKRVLIWGERV